MQKRLDGKVILITGASSGLGAAFARWAAEQGAVPVLADIADSAGEALRDELVAQGYAAQYLHLDVTCEVAWLNAVEQLGSRYGRLDVLLNNAGIALRGTVADCSLADWQRVIDVNLTGVFLGCRAVLPLMAAAGGSVINISSMYGLIGGADAAAYCAAKGGVTVLTKSAALHGASLPKPVRVNSVHPGYVDTPMVQGLEAGLDEGRAQTLRNCIVDSTPLKRLASPGEIVGLLGFLASDESSYVTGSQFSVDGGYTAH